MAEGELLILLSESLYDVLVSITSKHKCSIAEDLIEANGLISGYNFICRNERFAEWEANVSKQSISYTKKCLLNQINGLLTDEARMLSVRFNEFEISFLPKGKEPVYSGSGIWSRENRQSAKPARIVQKILVKKYSCKEFEDFNNWLKAELMDTREFHLVSGEDITKYYDANTYLKEEGTLGNSCMRYDNCSNFFRIYEDHAKMLICLHKDKLIGRAIVWTIGDKTLMDRIYTCYDYVENQFIDYARDHKWYHRSTNELLENQEVQRWLGPKSNYQTPEKLNLTINLGKSYDYFPYVDSFRYYDPDNNTISTIYTPGCCFLDCTDGKYEYDDNDDDDDDYIEYTCSHCGYTERVSDYDDLHNIVWSEFDDTYYCGDCAVYCDGIDDYVGPHHTIADVIIDQDDTGKKRYAKYPVNYLQNLDDEYVNIDGTWYYTSNNPCIIYDEKTGTWKVK